MLAIETFDFVVRR